MSLSRPQHKLVDSTCQFPTGGECVPTSDCPTLECVYDRWLVTVPSMVPSHVNTAVGLPEVVFQILKLVSKGMLSHVHLLAW